MFLFDFVDSFFSDFDANLVWGFGFRVYRPPQKGWLSR